MNQADYDAFLSDPLHREFVQEHERRTKEIEALLNEMTMNRDFWFEMSASANGNGEAKLVMIRQDLKALMGWAFPLWLTIIVGFGAVFAALKGWV